MKPIHSAQFVLEQHTDSDAVFELLQQEFSLHETAHTRLKRYYLDSFDWRMYRRNYVCGWDEPISKATKHPEGVFFIHDKSTDNSICELPLNYVPRFSKAIASPTYRQLLDNILGIRALIVVADLSVIHRQWLILNKENKTLAILQVESYVIQAHTGAKQFPGRLIVLPIRGYSKVGERVIDLIARHLKLQRAGDSVFDNVLTITGQKPDLNRLTTSRALGHALNTWEAVRIVLQRLFDVMWANEPGMREAIDTEFLHDYRVTVRRIRSILGQIKHVFPGNQLAYFKREFSWLGAVTTPTRDLDTYLLKFDDYVQELPQILQHDLEGFRLFLERHWKITHTQLCRALDSKRYQKLVSECQQLVASDSMVIRRSMSQKNQLPETVNATKPASDIARQRIWRLYRRILRDGGMITPQSHDENLHDLRKTCKKFRYLIECFQGYYAGQPIKKLLKILKQLQDNLGDFQDLCVQIQQLEGFAEQMRQEGLADTRTIMAMGVLVEKLTVRKVTARAEFAQRFKLFAQPDKKMAFADELRAHQGITQ